MSGQSTLGQIVDPLNQQVYPTLPVIVASDSPGANLILRSTNNGIKGAVLFDENTQSYGPQSGAVQVTGGAGIQGNMNIGGQTYLMPSFAGVGVININASGGGLGYKDYYVPVTISPPQVSNGITAQAFAIADGAAGQITKIFVYNQGYGYTAPPTVTINDQVPSSIFWVASTVYIVGQTLRVLTTNGNANLYTVTVAGTSGSSAPSHTTITGTTSATSTNSTTLTFASQPTNTAVGQTVFGVFNPTTGLPITPTVTNIAGGTFTLSQAITVGSSVTISFTGYAVANGSATMAFVGQTAGATSTIGYTGAIYNGALQGVGSIVSVHVQTAGSSFVQDVSRIVFPPPHVPGGKQATGYLSISSGAVSSVVITDPGSGYMFPPTLTLTGPGTAAVLVPIIGNPGHRPAVGVQPNNMASGGTFTLDIGMTGHHYVLLNANANFTLAFDTTKGFPQGREITVAVKVSGATTVTLGSSFVAGNNNKNSTSIALTNPSTAFFKFTVFGYSNAIGDVYCNITTG